MAVESADTSQGLAGRPQFFRSAKKIAGKLQENLEISRFRANGTVFTSQFTSSVFRRRRRLLARRPAGSYGHAPGYTAKQALFSNHPWQFLPFWAF
jgi:hypothetical protein